MITDSGIGVAVGVGVIVAVGGIGLGVAVSVGPASVGVGAGCPNGPRLHADHDIKPRIKTSTARSDRRRPFISFPFVFN